MRKPVVKYDPGLTGQIVLGKSVLVYPLTHTSPYVSNMRHATTSVVIRIGENGEFETKNSIYRPI